METGNRYLLEFTLDPESGVPFYKQIILRVEMAIADGWLLRRDQLPAVQRLAVVLQINPNMAARAYSELEIRGILLSRQGSGTFICDKKVMLPEIEREKTDVPDEPGNEKDMKRTVDS